MSEEVKASRETVSIEDYHDRRKSGPWISHSAMQYAFKVMPDKEWVWTPHRFQYYLAGRLKTSSTRDQDTGTIFHCLCEGVEPSVIVCPLERRGTKAWAKWELEEAEERGMSVDALRSKFTILKENEDKRLLDMYKALKENKIFQGILAEERVAKEGTVRWLDAKSGIKLQARPDLETVDTIIDYKTSSAPEDWLLNAYDHGYHRQAAMQIAGVRAVSGKTKRLIHVVVGKSFPFEIINYELPPNAIALGGIEVSEILQRISEWIAFDSWESPWNERIVTTDFPVSVYRGKAI